MTDRFTGPEGRRLVRQSILDQQCVAHNESVADALLTVQELAVFREGDCIIKQGGHDNDLYLILAGTASVQVNGREVARRYPGSHVGEMGLIEPAAPRCATVIAQEMLVTAKISEPAFSAIAEQHPSLWRRLAMELGMRLRERNKLVREPNRRPMLFVGSSVEGLVVAKQLQSCLAHLDAVVHVWTNNLFVPGHYTMEDLESTIRDADFGIIVCTQDDEVFNEGRHVDALAPRDNCILELGMCIGQLGRERTAMVRPRTKSIKIPTDLLGITAAEYTLDEDLRNLAAHLGPVCTAIEQLVKQRGVR